MRKTIIFLISLVCVLSCSQTREKALLVPQREGLVNDYAGLFSSSQKEQLTQMLVRLDNEKHIQLCVVVVNDLQGRSAAEFATELGHSWGVGRKGEDSGLLLLVKPKTHDSKGDVFIAMGYGMEGDLPDSKCGRILDENAVPFFKEDKYFDGVFATCLALIKVVAPDFDTTAEYNPLRQEQEVEEDDDFLGEIFVAVLVLGLIGMLLLVLAGRGKGGKGGNGSNGGGNGSKGVDPTPFIVAGLLNSGRRGGGGGSFGGGSSGGFGGFGGFGGGGFGGGGAGRSW